MTSGQLVWACQGKTCYSVPKPDGTYQLVWSVSQDLPSQSTASTTKRKRTPKDMSQSALLNKIGPALW